MLLLLTIMQLLLTEVPMIEETSLQEDQHQTTISTMEEDVTKDGRKEKIELYGTYLSETTTFLKNVSISITNETNKKWHIALKEGYDPTVSFIDITNNGTMNILYKVALNKERTMYDTQIYEFQHGSFKKIPLPHPVQLDGKFQHGFTVILRDPIQNDTFNIALDGKEDQYTKANIYDTNGTLLKKQKVHISPIINTETVTIHTANGYSIKTTQFVAGIDKYDLLAKIDSIYHYQNGKWTLIKQNIEPM
ncbi:hypothetical protein [Pseudogracilibacillus sp. ICA-222130]|uniref:hypothetical protein n=1 Tax=Pseudogracilibacillus sp. ICA-222130 TaxID=3134655 RepID=UPI0030C04F24